MVRSLHPKQNVSRRFRFTIVLISCLVPLQSATLERLSLEDLVEKSTSIVRGRVADTSATMSGATIFTVYRVEVSERWKGPAVETMDVRVPGGQVNGIRQVCEGAPELVPGQEYVLFLWTSRSGATYITGFTQGLFELPRAGGDRMAIRPASGDIMLEPQTGRRVQSERIALRLSELSTRISSNLARGVKR